MKNAIRLLSHPSFSAHPTDLKFLYCALGGWFKRWPDWSKRCSKKFLSFYFTLFQASLDTLYRSFKKEPKSWPDFDKVEGIWNEVKNVGWFFKAFAPFFWYRRFIKGRFFVQMYKVECIILNLTQHFLVRTESWIYDIIVGEVSKLLIELFILKV